MCGAKNKDLGDFNAGIENTFVRVRDWYSLFFSVDVPWFFNVGTVNSMLSPRIITLFGNLTVV
jgi:hypothetical protein